MSAEMSTRRMSTERTGVGPTAPLSRPKPAASASAAASKPKPKAKAKAKPKPTASAAASKPASKPAPISKVGVAPPKPASARPRAKPSGAKESRKPTPTAERGDDGPQQHIAPIYGRFLYPPVSEAWSHRSDSFPGASRTPMPSFPLRDEHGDHGPSRTRAERRPPSDLRATAAWTLPDGRGSTRNTQREQQRELAWAQEQELGRARAQARAHGRPGGVPNINNMVITDGEAVAMSRVRLALSPLDGLVVMLVGPDDADAGWSRGPPAPQMQLLQMKHTDTGDGRPPHVAISVWSRSASERNAHAPWLLLDPRLKLRLALSFADAMAEKDRTDMLLHLRLDPREPRYAPAADLIGGEAHALLPFSIVIVNIVIQCEFSTCNCSTLGILVDTERLLPLLGNHPDAQFLPSRSRWAYWHRQQPPSLENDEMVEIHSSFEPANVASTRWLQVAQALFAEREKLLSVRIGGGWAAGGCLGGLGCLGGITGGSSRTWQDDRRDALTVAALTQLSLEMLHANQVRLHAALAREGHAAPSRPRGRTVLETTKRTQAHAHTHTHAHAHAHAHARRHART